MRAWKVILLMAIVELEAVHIVAGNGLGFMGCYPVGSHWQDIFTQDYKSGSVDDCVVHCTGGKSHLYAAISIQTCYCSNRLPDIQLSPYNYCNSTCLGDASQVCGSRTQYSIHRTRDRVCDTLMPPPNGEIRHSLFVVGRNVTFSCFPGFQLNIPATVRCVESESGSSKHPYWSGEVPSCIHADTTTNVNEGTVMMDSPIKTDSGSSRFFIDAIVIICVSCFVILLFFAARYQKRRHNRNSGHDLPGMTGIQNNITTNPSRPGVVNQSLILNTIHHNIQSTNVDISSLSDSDSHQVSSLNKTDCDDDTTTSSHLEGHADCTAPSTEKESVKHADGATVRQETIDVDADGYVPMGRISRLSLNMEYNPMLRNKDNKRITHPQRVNYENRDVWSKRDQKSQLKNTISP
eukprot:XP_011665891.1 PREDICTED: uncharacterized protein LOC105439061 [Strongylocentrotus purpuratus]